VVGLAPVGRLWPAGAREPGEQGPGGVDGGGESGGQPLGAVRHSPIGGASLKMLVARMGWGTREGIRFTIGEYTVRLGSALQHDQVRQRRADAHRLFVADTVGRAPKSPVVAEEVQRLTETLPRLCRK
jgi:hypothetical protein